MSPAVEAGGGRSTGPQRIIRRVRRAHHRNNPIVRTAHSRTRRHRPAAIGVLQSRLLCRRRRRRRRRSRSARARRFDSNVMGEPLTSPARRAADDFARGKRTAGARKRGHGHGPADAGTLAALPAVARRRGRCAGREFPHRCDGAPGAGPGRAAGRAPEADLQLGLGLRLRRPVRRPDGLRPGGAGRERLRLDERLPGPARQRSATAAPAPTPAPRACSAPATTASTSTAATTACFTARPSTRWSAPSAPRT